MRSDWLQWPPSFDTGRGAASDPRGTHPSQGQASLSALCTGRGERLWSSERSLLLAFGLSAPGLLETLAAGMVEAIGVAARDPGQTMPRESGAPSPGETAGPERLLARGM